MFTAKDINDFVDQRKEEILDCLVDILQTPSVTEDEVAVSKVFYKWLDRYGLNPKIVGITSEHPNVLAEWFGSRPGKRFLFNGHMDHFPPVDGDPGMFGPYSGKIVDGYVYGRGACDMKGGDAAVLMATAMLKKMTFDPKGSVFLSFTCDEQIGGRYGIKWLVKQGYMEGDFGIVPEPTAKQVMLGHSGILRMYITYTAPAAHSGRHHPTMDALEKSVHAITALYKYRQEILQRATDPDYGEASHSITTIHAGTATNVHATKSTFSIDRRLIPGETHVIAQAEIFDVLDGLKGEFPNIDMNYTCEMISDRPFLDVPADSPVVLAAMEAFEEVTGRKAETLKRHGGSDAATVQAYNGMHLPNWGAAGITFVSDIDKGYGGAQPNERISVDDYIESVKYYMLTVVKLLS